MKRLIYLVYYIKETDFNKFSKFLNYSEKVTGKSKITLLIDLVYSVLKYNISLLDYFYFRFFEKGHQERIQWAGTGYMYEYQLKMNPKETRNRLEDKRIFLEKYSDFVSHPFLSLDDLANGNSDISSLIGGSTTKIVLKDALGQCGNGVEIIESNTYSKEGLISYMREKGFNMVEAFVQQHPELHKISPSALNTVRVFTQLDETGKVVILGSRLRVSINSNVDNLAAGNMAVELDTLSGIVVSDGVFSDITKEDCAIHPVSGVKLKGFQVPFWKETIALVTKAALLDVSNKSVGWDIAITTNGPELIEGNHNWCKLLWQLPVKKGLKHLIEKYNV